MFFRRHPAAHRFGIDSGLQASTSSANISASRIVALGIDLIWGYTGLLSLCQALFFCLGGYAMAMHLSLPQGGGDVRPEYHNIPQFMFFNNVQELPTFWKPFASLPFTIAAGICLAGIRRSGVRILHPPQPGARRLLLDHHAGRRVGSVAAHQPK